ncbi:MAG: hypothetical protein LBM64_03995 [Deltaproteobacteria bacterium]|jgi:hypothetical protein|nr:hypothetical protein [Deltaproteobacteria bacterium]
MNALQVKLIAEGRINDKFIPLDIVFVDKRDIAAAGIDDDKAIRAIAGHLNSPCGINIFDLDAVTTTSDGIMIEGAIVEMTAADRGKINADFGRLSMARIPYSEEILALEPHLKQWKKRYPGRALYRGPNPATKIIPVHNVVISGRASNNNSATEMMNIVTMEEILLPILGQMQCLKGEGNVLVGNTGAVISVGIGMTVAEQFGRVFPTRQFKAGETAHGSGEYAKTLKKNIPCIVADKAVLAGYIMNALDDGCLPGRDIGCSPAVLCVAKHYGAPMDLDNIAGRAWEELESVGINRAFLEERVAPLSRPELLARADELIPGVEDARALPAAEVARAVEIPLA